VSTGSEQLGVETISGSMADMVKLLWP